MLVAGRNTRPKSPAGRQALGLSALLMLYWTSLAGCSLLPDVRHKPQYINPFPQIKTVAVLPFANQSEEPTLSGERVALAYINELQAIRGFEVLPLGAVQLKLREFDRPLASGEDFQAFAQALGVDVVLVGAVTDYDPFYPPRMSMKVNWYAANPGFHPVLPGYGLPWGTKEEKQIPRWIHQEAQRALAAEQLRTQTPGLAETSLPSPSPLLPNPQVTPQPLPAPLMPEDRRQLESSDAPLPNRGSATNVAQASGIVIIEGSDQAEFAGGLPADWPDPRGFIPDSPSPQRPEMRVQHEPIISHMRNFNGHDEDFTEQLADYFYFRDDARFGGWQAYLQRSEDFIRFCCHLHLVETLSSRGGQDKSRLIFRWPIDRYTR